MYRAAALALALSSLVACIDAQLVDCDDGRACPVGTVCITIAATAEPQCARRDDLDACDGSAAFAPCDLGGPPAACYETTTGLVCLVSGCGNGLVDPDEVCDDRNAAVGDGCSVGCQSDESCGNGIVDPLALDGVTSVPNEQCDDLNLVGHDGCSSACQTESPQWERLGLGLPGAAFGRGLAYDASRQRLVAFGGAYMEGLTITPLSNDETWEHSDAGWVQVPTQIAPSPRSGAAMAYDAARRRVVLFGGGATFNSALADTWEWDGATWTARFPPVAPEARRDAAIAYDSRRQRVVLWGGGGGQGQRATLGDHWEWDGTTWTEVVSAVAPPARSAAAMVYDPRRDVMVLAGGAPIGSTWELSAAGWSERADAGATPPELGAARLAFDGTGVISFGGKLVAATSDTWRWDGQRWTRVATTGPGARLDAAMSYDPRRDRVVLVGGRYISDSCLSCTATFGDVWDWNPAAQTWTERTQPTPAPRWNHRTAFDARRGRVVMFGGNSALGPFSGLIGETWEFDGTAWVPHVGAEPDPRMMPGLAYDAARGVTVLFGGYTSTGFGDDTWTWDGTTWTRLAPATSPSARWGAAMGYDAKRRQVVLFGGVTLGGAATGDTWAWDGTTWAQVASLTLGSPSQRRDATMTYDPVREQLVMFGGEFSASTTPIGDAWTWDGTTWTALAGTTPPARAGSSLAWNAARRRVTLFGGGSTNTPTYRDTWELGNSWLQPALPAAPGVRRGMSLMPLPDGSGVGMFGGLGAAVFDEMYRLRWQHHGAYERCGLELDEDGDGLAGCADPDCWATCTPLCPPGAPCDASGPRCGDGVCDTPRESCRSCAQDCSPCPAVCGDTFCDPGEPASCIGDCP